MSHTVKNTAKLSHKELDLIKRVGRNMGIKVEELKNYKMYDGTVLSGIGIYLPGWKYPAILTESNEMVYDNYNNQWGHINELKKFETEYVAETQRDYLRMMGVHWEEEKNEVTGEIEMVVEI